MPSLDQSAITWRKSSHSNPDGGECLEVSDDLLDAAYWHKSSYSNSDGGECVEVWRKSSYSNQDGGACVEVADNVKAAVPVRDSKNPRGPALIFPAAHWTSFVTALKGGTLNT